MKKNLQKALSLMVSASIMLTVASCAKSIEEPVLDMADDLGKYIVDRDYNKIKKLTGEKNDKLEEILSLSDDSTETDVQAREIIASTLSYEVDEDSYDGDKEEGSVDIIFTYVDYEKAIEDIPVFQDIDAFEEAIEDCDDKIETTITFEFEKDGDDIVCVNIGDIKEIFPYADEEFSFVLAWGDYISCFDFEGCSSGFTCNDVDHVTCILDVTGDGQYLTWDYYYTVDFNDVPVYESDVITVEEPTELTGEYWSEDGDLLEDGQYYIAFYTPDDEFIYSGCCNVTHTEVTPTPAPTPAPVSPTFDEVTAGPELVVPEDGIVYVPDTTIVIEMPDGFTCVGPEDQRYQDTMQGNQTLSNTIVFCAVDEDGNRFYLMRASNTEAYNDPTVVENFATTVDNVSSTYGGYGFIVTRIDTTYQVDGREISMYTIALTGGPYNLQHFDYMTTGLLGDEDDYFILCVESNEIGTASSVVNHITFG